MRISALIKLAIASLIIFATPSYAGEAGVDINFSDGEVSLIRAYYRDHAGPHNGNNKGNKNGRNKGLPPGIQKNLQRGKQLPPGIAKQALPAGLISQLPPPPKGFERIELSGKVLLVEIATQVIHDVLEDIVY